MKIASDFVRIVDPLAVAESRSRDPNHRPRDLARPAERRPVEEVQAIQRLAPLAHRPARGGPDPVNLSKLAQSSMAAQDLLIERLQQKVSESLQAEEIDLSEREGLDYAPDAVSQRIVDFSIRLYGVFRDKHPALSEEGARTKFADTIGAAMERGYQEAREELLALSTPEEVLATSEETMSLVRERLTEWRRGPAPEK